MCKNMQAVNGYTAVLLNVNNITMIGQSLRHGDAVHFKVAQIVTNDEATVATLLGRHLVHVQVAVLRGDQ